MEHWTDMEQIWGGSGLPVLVLAPEAEGCATVYGNAAAQEDAPTKVKECLGKIKIASNHMMSLLNEVLIVAGPRPTPGSPNFIWRSGSWSGSPSGLTGSGSNRSA